MNLSDFGSTKTNRQSRHPQQSFTFQTSVPYQNVYYIDGLLVAFHELGFLCLLFSEIDRFSFLSNPFLLGLVRVLYFFMIVGSFSCLFSFSHLLVFLALNSLCRLQFAQSLGLCFRCHNLGWIYEIGYFKSFQCHVRLENARFENVDLLMHLNRGLVSVEPYCRDLLYHS